MTRIRTTLGRWGIPLAGAWFLLVGVMALTSLSISPIIMGILALFVGLCLLCAS